MSPCHITCSASLAYNEARILVWVKHFWRPQLINWYDPGALNHEIMWSRHFTTYSPSPPFQRLVDGKLLRLGRVEPRLNIDNIDHRSWVIVFVHLYQSPVVARSSQIQRARLRPAKHCLIGENERGDCIVRLSLPSRRYSFYSERCCLWDPNPRGPPTQTSAGSLDATVSVPG